MKVPGLNFLVGSACSSRVCVGSPSALDSSRSLWSIRGTGDSKLAVGGYESLRLSLCVSQDALMP